MGWVLVIPTVLYSMKNNVPSEFTTGTCQFLVLPAMTNGKNQ